MSLNTILMHFCANSDSRKKSQEEIKKVFAKNLIDSFPGMKMICDFNLSDGAYAVWNDEFGVTCTLRVFNEGLITLNIDFLERKGVGGVCHQFSRKLVDKIEQQLELTHSQSLPAIKRDGIVRYLPLADGRISELDADETLFDKRSEFQKVQIVHSKTLGNMLILDELQNLGECDLIYTETLMQRGKENYEGKEICILGGGDGALLYELLKENPKHVVMLEIDDLVMEACNKFMNSICGDVLEVRRRENYEIIVGDCMVWLEKYIKDGKKFDYVFGDLTDIPISDTPTGEIWDFIRTILEASFKVLKSDGKFMTHGNGASCPESLEMYEEQLKKLRPVVKFTRDTAFVPSFMEDWIFYQVAFADQ